MYFLFSGEGPSDIGNCADGTDRCEGKTFSHGPMAIIVDRIVENRHDYSLLEFGHYGYVSEHVLAERAVELKAIKKSIQLPGKKRPIETAYFYKNARLLARISREQERQINDDVVAVLFRDSDDTASDGRGLWDDKRQSMLDGFEIEKFKRGVPMIPKPKSEAWIICAVKQHPYHNCESLESRSGNDKSPNSLKKELERILGEPASRELLNQKLTDGSIDINRINMPSFQAFRDRLENVI
jgi:hypothetical protein